MHQWWYHQGVFTYLPDQDIISQLPGITAGKREDTGRRRKWSNKNILLLWSSEVIDFSLNRKVKLFQGHVGHFVESCKESNSFPFTSRSKSGERGCKWRKTDTTPAKGKKFFLKPEKYHALKLGRFDVRLSHGEEKRKIHMWCKVNQIKRKVLSFRWLCCVFFLFV